MKESVPDPIEISESRIDRYASMEKNTCMVCNKQVDYDLICIWPTGDGPALCIECSGYDKVLKEQEDKHKI
jgi:hypothetical protein